MIAHDIVFLEKAVTSYKHLNPRWISKVFTEAEKKYIFRASRPALACWTLWAIKESVYKLELKMGCQRRFAPKKILANEFVDNFQNVSPGEMQLQFQNVRLRIRITTNFILCLAFFPSTLYSWKIGFRPLLSKKEQSVYARQELKNHLKYTFGWGENDVSFYKDEKGIPLCRNLSTESTINLSFSHDGPFFSYAFTISEASPIKNNSLNL